MADTIITPEEPQTAGSVLLPQPFSGPHANDIYSTIELKENTVIIVLGASGDLAKKKTFPALFGLVKVSRPALLTHR
jgi:hypothetical protein